MFNSKVNHMTVIVKGVRDDDYEGRELMMEVVRRNCKMDPRLVSQMVYSIRTYEDGKKKRTDFNIEFEAFDMGGIIRDFELLKKAGVILNRKMLAELAVSDKEAFASLVETAKKAL